jgi:hypothetical protein
MRLGFPYTTTDTGVEKTEDLLPLPDKKKIGVLCVMSAHHQICTVAGQEHQRVKCSTSILTACCWEGNIFSMCCSTGEFFLHFLKVSITVNIFCHFLHQLLNLLTAYDVTSRVSGRRLSKQEKMPLYIGIFLFDHCSVIAYCTA